jgi:hypothetical protein
MSSETTGIVRYGENTPIADGMMTRLRESVLSEEPAIPGFISIEQFARQMDVALSTVRRWKARRYGPTFVKIGRKDYCKDTAAADFAAALLAEAAPRPRGRPRKGPRHAAK